MNHIYQVIKKMILAKVINEKVETITLPQFRQRLKNFSDFIKIIEKMVLIRRIIRQIPGNKNNIWLLASRSWPQGKL